MLIPSGTCGVAVVFTVSQVNHHRHAFGCADLPEIELEMERSRRGRPPHSLFRVSPPEMIFSLAGALSKEEEIRTKMDSRFLPELSEQERAQCQFIRPSSFLPSSFSPLLASSFWGGFHSQFLDQVEVFSSSFDRVGYRSTKIVAPMSCIYILSTSSSE